MGIAINQSPKPANHQGFGSEIALTLVVLSLSFLPQQNLCAGDPLHAGPLFDDFSLTLEPGHRAEAAGPFYYQEQTVDSQTWALPPLFALARYTNIQSCEFTLAYPIMSYVRYGEQYRWHFFQLLSFAGGPSQTETNRNRFTLFPIYFQQRSSDPSQNYTAYGPFYGHLQSRLFRDEITYVMFPFYSETRKRDVITDNYLFPLVHVRHGDGLNGWQAWPLAGHEHKDVTTRTNRFQEAEMVPGHDRFFLLWPFFFNERAGIGTTNLEKQYGVLPAFSVTRSPQRDATTVVWPLFSYVEDREQKYHEWDLPWLLVEFARGEGKYTSRVWPFYSHSYSSNQISDFCCWPIYHFTRVQSAPLDRRHTRILYFLYSDVNELDTEHGTSRQRSSFWPFYTASLDAKGNRRLQVLSILEPFLPESRSIAREYAPVYSLWRSEANARTGASSQSLLWNLYRRETTPQSRRCSFLFGLWQSESGPTGHRAKLFYVPLGKRPVSPPPPTH